MSVDITALHRYHKVHIMLLITQCNLREIDYDWAIITGMY